MNMNIFHLKSLKTRMTLFMLVVFLTGIWSLAFYASRMLREDMQRTMSDQQLSMVSLLAAQINKELDERLRALEKISRGISPTILNNVAALQTLLEQRILLQILFNGGIIAINTEGTAIADVPLSAGRIGLNYMDRDFILIALKEGKSTIGRPVMGKKLLAPLLVMAVPIHDEQGKVVGALMGVTSLEQPNFLDKITENRYGLSGGYFLLAPQYRLIVTASDKTRVMEKFPAPGINPVLDRFIQGYEGSVVHVNPLGVEVLASAKSIPLAGWFMGAALPTEEAFAPIRAMQLNMLQAVIILTLLVTGLTWWILRRLLSPMLAAARTLATLSDTDQPPQPLPIISQDEIGELIQGFNRLLETLAKREEALQKSENNYRILLETTSEGFWWLNLERKTVEVNMTLCKMLGYSQDEMIGKTPFDFVDDENRNIFIEQTSKISITEHRSYEIALKKKNGENIHTNFNATSINDESGKVQGSFALITDITERKRIAATLFESEEKYRSMMEAMEDPVYICSPDFRVEYVNPAMSRAVGHDTTGESCSQAIYGFDKKCPWCVHEQIQKGESAITEFFNPKDGHTYHVSHSPIFHIDNSISKMTMYRDITQRKHLEEEREKLIKELQDALTKIKTLSGLLPICSYCKKIRDDKGYWNQIETYIRDRTEAEFSHGICQECAKKYYPDMNIYGE